MTGKSEYDAVIVGSGPNGLAAGITFAQAGRSALILEAQKHVGGGTRTMELTKPGFRHDVCSTAHPLARVSPFFRSLDLASFGLEWVHPEAPLAHPLDDEDAVILERSVETTADGLGPDGDAYRRLVAPFVPNAAALMEDLLRPLGLPSRPVTLSRFGLVALRSARSVALGRFRGRRARALFAGNAAHAIMPLDRASSAAFGLTMSVIGHAAGWPFARGGSQAIANALAAYFKSLGGEIRLNAPVRSIDDFPRARATLFTLTPRQLDRIAGPQLPSAYRDRLESHRYGAGVFKVDWALGGPVPWTDPTCLRAGTAHIGGTLEEIAAAEAQVGEGKAPERPFVLFTQPTLFDPSRAPEGRHIAWAYCHVPNGCPVDMTDRIEAQIERFAPGFRDRIIARRSMSPADMEEYNPNYVGGDIVGGIQSFGDFFIRPLGRWSAYTTPAEGIYICSSSMPPGGGVHGMCGRLAALRALRDMD